MPNPLLDAMAGQAIPNMNDPLKLLESNPNTAQIAQLIRSGADPKQIFLEECRKRGIDPNTVLSRLPR